MEGMEVQKAPQLNLEGVQPEVMAKLSAADKLHIISRAVHQDHDLVYVRSMDALYYKRPGDQIYEPLDNRDLLNWVRDYWLEAFTSFRPKDLEDTVRVVEVMTTKEVESLNGRYIACGPYSYWDNQNGELVHVVDEPTFRRFFDTLTPTKHVPKIEPFTKEQDKRMWERYEQVKHELLNREFVERYDFIKTWAAGDHDVYLDMLRSYAYSLLKKKPVGAYILKGLKRNGKSAFVGSHHWMWGTRNTSKVQMAELGDPHITHTLLNTMMNAPDEEEETALKSQSTFKTMCDHGVLNLPVMRSNVPVSLECDFMSFFPMNHMPEFKGTGASACIERCLVIPFEADLSANDKGNVNFAEETFTSDLACDFMGTVFAYAWYYSRHELEFSDRMLEERGALEEDIDSALTYRKKFEQYFDGFTSFKLAYQDYQLWCKTEDIKIQTYDRFKFVFDKYRAKRTSIRINGEHTKVFRVPQLNHKVMYPDLFTEVGKVIVLHEEKNCSVVERLDHYYSRKKWEKTVYGE